MTAVQALLKLQTSRRERGPVRSGLGLGREAPGPRSPGTFEDQREE